MPLFAAADRRRISPSLHLFPHTPTTTTTPAAAATEKEAAPATEEVARRRARARLSVFERGRSSAGARRCVIAHLPPPLYTRTLSLDRPPLPPFFFTRDSDYTHDSDFSCLTLAKATSRRNLEGSTR